MTQRQLGVVRLRATQRVVERGGSGQTVGTRERAREHDAVFGVARMGRVPAAQDPDRGARIGVLETPPQQVLVQPSGLQGERGLQCFEALHRTGDVARLAGQASLEPAQVERLRVSGDLGTQEHQRRIRLPAVGHVTRSLPAVASGYGGRLRNGGLREPRLDRTLRRLSCRGRRALGGCSHGSRGERPDDRRGEREQQRQQDDPLHRVVLHCVTCPFERNLKRPAGVANTVINDMSIQ